MKPVKEIRGPEHEKKIKDAIRKLGKKDRPDNGKVVNK